MTMINVGDDTEVTGGGLSANALVAGGDRNLLFTLRHQYQATSGVTLAHDGILNVQRRLKLSKIATLVGAKVAAASVPTQEIAGRIRVVRGSATAAQLNFSIPPSGQIPAPNGTVTLTKDDASTVTKDRSKRWKFGAVRTDSSGQTPLGALTPELWLGEGSTIVTPTFELFPDAVVGNNQLGSGVPVEITVVPYDKLIDKEGAPTNIQLNWSMGPFSVSSSFGPTVNSASGNLPQGTVINLQRVTTYPDGSMSLEGPQVNYTIDGSGGASFNPGGGASQITSGNSSIYVQSAILYKLSTHSNWTLASGNQVVIVANPWSQGGVSTPPATKTFSAVAYVQMRLAMQIPHYGPNFNDRFDLKVFTAGKQVLGAGRTVTGQDQWPYPLSWQIDAGGTNFRTNPSMIIGQPYANEHTNYANGTPRGDQYYVAGEKNAVNVAVAPRFGVTNLKIYAAQATANTTTGAVVGSYGNWGLIYDGPPVASFKWLGAIINSSPSIPTANTTANYALQSGQVSWDSSDAEEIIIEPGDQVIASCHAGTFSDPAATTVQIALPIQLLD